MNKPACGALMLLLMMMAACQPSLQPLYTKETLVFDPSLLGTWRDEDGTLFKLLGAPDNRYDVLVTEDGDSRRMRAFLVQVGKERFLDFYPEDLETKNSFYAAHLMPIHMFFRIRRNGDAIEACALDDSWLRDQFNAGRFKVLRQKIDKDYLLTAGPAELQEFLSLLSGDKDAFSDPEIYRRVP